MTLPEITDTDQLQELLGGQTHAPDFALIYIELCIAVFATDPNKILNNLQTVTRLPGCHWECKWGPATDPKGANLVMVATAVNDRTNASLLHIVVIRGTDISWKSILGDFKQFIEDLDVRVQVNLPWTNAHPLAQIARGTAKGLASIEAMRWPAAQPNRTLTQFLADTQGGPSQSRPPIVVTGHSLGGCLTSVVAPALAHALPGSAIMATSFAGPSAGNQEFTEYLHETIPVFYRYFNTLDTVPNWWANLNENNHIYDAHCLKTPGSIVDADKFFNFIDPKYAQPAKDRAITGIFQRNQDWIGEAEFQHHATTYRLLLRLKDHPG